jgi:hypothetical protein
LPLLAQPGSARPSPRRAGRGTSTGEAALAGLGLRLSRHLRDTGGATLFVPLHDGHEVEGLVSHISRYLASRRERVLILDGRPGAPGTPTSPGEGETPPSGSPPSAAAEGMAPSANRLSPALAGEDRDPVELVRSTGAPHVDHLRACGCGGVLDCLAPGPLEELLGRLSQHYPRILVIGPALSHALEAEILARCVQGIIVALGSSAGRPSPEARRLIRELQADDVPLLGAVIHNGLRDGGPGRVKA